MSYVIAAPEMMTSAATDLAAIGSNVDAAHLVAAARTTSVLPAAADEVSASIAQVFSQHAASYQALAGQAAAFQEQFVQHLTAGAFSYASIEAAIAGFLQNLNGFANWFVTPITYLQGATPLSPEQFLGLALIAPIYIPALLVAEAVILPIVILGPPLLWVVILGVALFGPQLAPLLASFGI